MFAFQRANHLLEHIPVKPRTASLEMLRSDVGEVMMKKIIVIAISMLAVTALAIVGPGKAQKITVTRDAEQNLVFKVDDGKSFADVDACAIHCYQRSSWRDKRSDWANLVDIRFVVQLSADDRLYIGDRFVANKVYPDKMTWVESGKTNTVVYRPDNESIRERRTLK